MMDESWIKCNFYFRYFCLFEIAFYKIIDKIYYLSLSTCINTSDSNKTSQLTTQIQTRKDIHLWEVETFFLGWLLHKYNSNNNINYYHNYESV